jgi:Bacterial mobilisation protein (MobC)
MSSGSDKRQRPSQSLVRWTNEEFARVAAKADKAGLAMAAFIRAATLGDAGPRAQRRPPADHKALRQILGQLGRIGNNINQIARALNTGGQTSSAELKEARRACQDMRKALLEALGKNPGPGT